MYTPLPDPADCPSAPKPEMSPPAKFVTLPPPRTTTPSTPDIEPELDTVPAPNRRMPYPLADVTVPALPIVQVMFDEPSIASRPDPVAPTLPVVVIVRGLSAGCRLIGPAVALLIVLAIYRSCQRTEAAALPAPLTSSPQPASMWRRRQRRPISYPLQLDSPAAPAAPAAHVRFPAKRAHGRS